MLKIDAEKVKANKLPIGLLSIELAAALLAVYFFYKVLGFNFDLASRIFSLNPPLQPEHVFFFGVSIALLLAAYLGAKRKSPELAVAQEKAKKTIGDGVKSKLLAVKDSRAVALILIEASFVVAVALTIVAWFDPEIEIVQWSRLGITDPLTTILNGIVAVALLAIFYYIYSFTSWYRKK